MIESHPGNPLRLAQLLFLTAVFAVSAEASVPSGAVCKPGGGPGTELAQARRPDPPVRGSSAEVHGGSSADVNQDRRGSIVPRDRATRQAAERRRREAELEERRERARKQRAAENRGEN